MSIIEYIFTTLVALFCVFIICLEQIDPSMANSGPSLTLLAGITAGLTAETYWKNYINRTRNFDTYIKREDNEEKVL